MKRGARGGALVAAGVIASAAMGGLGCRGKAGNVASVRDALAGRDTAEIAKTMADAPSCAGVAEAGARAPDACLAEMAAWLGSKTGFNVDPPDQASATAAAIIVVRDGHGEWLPAADAWLVTVRQGKGAGADALRLGLARAIGDAAKALPLPVETEPDARKLMAAVARSIPGACDTYQRLGAGLDVAAGPPERTADHSPCVQQDLDRPTGPKEHGRYGTGVWRGAIAAQALLREAVAALKDGASHADSSVREKLDAVVANADAVAGKVVTQPPDATSAIGDAMARWAAMHVDAGAVPAPQLPVTPRPAGSGR